MFKTTKNRPAERRAGEMAGENHPHLEYPQLRQVTQPPSCSSLEPHSGQNLASLAWAGLMSGLGTPAGWGTGMTGAAGEAAMG